MIVKSDVEQGAFCTLCEVLRVWECVKVRLLAKPRA